MKLPVSVDKLLAMRAELMATIGEVDAALARAGVQATRRPQQMSSVRARALAALQSGPKTRAQVAEATGHNPRRNAVDMLLCGLVLDGVAKRVARGTYALVES